VSHYYIGRIGGLLTSKASKTLPDTEKGKVRAL